MRMRKVDVSGNRVTRRARAWLNCAMKRPLLALTLLAACSASPNATLSKPPAPLAKGAPWPKFRGDAAQTGASAVRPTKMGGALWDFRTAKGIFSSPVVAADGTIYVGSADRTFYALNADGTLKWKLLTGEIIDSAALLD